MAPRRTLQHALEIMTSEKLAFIRGGGDVGTPVLDIAATASAPETVPNRAAAERSTSEWLKPETEVPDNRPSLLGEVLIPLTTRIRPETANALRRAYLEQKLAHRTPATQQEIIEEALVAWLEKHGFR